MYLDFPKWSPDGERIAYQADAEIHVIDVLSRFTRRLTDRSITQSGPSWSSDGQWIYFQRRPKQGIWRVSADGTKGPMQVTRETGSRPMPSPDGTHLFYVQNAHELWMVAVAGGTPECLLKDLSNDGNFVVRSDGVYFVAQTDTASLDFLDLRARVRKTLVRLQYRPMWGLSVSPDGKTILHTQNEPNTSEVMLVDNFR